MFKLDNQFLIDLGLGNLPAAEKNKLLAHTYETLELRVGMKLAEQMSDAQLDEFEGFISRQDEAGALKWLETNFPNYKDVVQQELEKLREEIKKVVPQILATSQQAPVPGQPPTNQPASYVSQPQPTYQPQTNPQPQFSAPAPSYPQAPTPNFSQPQPTAPQPQYQQQPTPQYQPPAYQPAPGFGSTPAVQPQPMQQPQFQPPQPQTPPANFQQPPQPTPPPSDVIGSQSQF